jgi:hypothetical protein
MRKEKEKETGPVFTVYVRNVDILRTEVRGVKTLEEALVKAKTIELSDYTIEDSAFQITGVNNSDHFNTD